MQDTPLTLVITPEDTRLSLRAARSLRSLGMPSSGAFLTAAEAIIERGGQITKASLADALHEHE